MESRDETIAIEVVYALPGHQVIRELRLPSGTTVKGAVERSGIADLYPEIDFARNKLGIFGKLVDPGRRLCAGDRVEIYRPLARDPKEIRRERARLRHNTSVAKTFDRPDTA
ncbi:MAG TPA: RnfH family protein [Nitrosospira sp.]|nr:RnfH family protein [Nitrosospira sp.]